ncbi:MAG: protein-glutamate O-methyltransferase [Deltaproteobacteria bacterium HGW-Deltaproteobacteria-19]|jgi:chemotaxis protein methyltransferase CheR|nr:MAG: protein-glutamate O-methyltransferase [Deltaproteobacteria bacterium HGW-Deltaproteobacteria-19]
MTLFQSATELKDNEYEKISRLVYEQCGICLHEGKKDLVKARLGKRLREGGFKSFLDYYKYVTTKDGTEELITMIDSISTNVTYFFREEKHFQKMTTLLPELAREKEKKGRTEAIRIWTAGCSTGEEPYSVAMSLSECLKDRQTPFHITATDISTRVLQTATQGVYPADKVKGVPPPLMKRYFQYGTGTSDGQVRIKREIRDRIAFERFNLMDIPRFSHPFDIIFCRNVMIYFDKSTQSAVVKRFYDVLQPSGHLFIGHSETLTGLDHQFHYVQPSIYRK